MDLSVSDVLIALAKQRPLFHSEADFQHTVAWEIHERLPRASVRLERPVEVSHLNKPLHVDIWIEQDGDVIALELTYKTRALQVRAGNEQYALRSQSAQDHGRYDFIKDIERIESIVADRAPHATGYAILLTDQGLLFTTGTGSPINPSNLRQRSFARLLKEARLPHIRFHDLRHTCATLLLTQGTHPKYVQDLLGHATIAITLDTYSHVMPGMGDQTARAMQDALS